MGDMSGGRPRGAAIALRCTNGCPVRRGAKNLAANRSAAFALNLHRKLGGARLKPVRNVPKMAVCRLAALGKPLAIRDGKPEEVGFEVHASKHTPFGVTIQAPLGEFTGVLPSGVIPR